jgi:hypothetical protein
MKTVVKLKKVKRKEHTGLSPSSLTLLQTCARKYYHRKVAKTLPDPGEENIEALSVGKAFHQVLEDCKHDLTPFKYSTVVKACLKHDLDEDSAPLIAAMLKSYRTMHQEDNLEVLACEVELETPEFYGFIDAIMMDKDGHWWIVDMKTAASYSRQLQATVSRHLQLNLYAAHAYIVSEKFDLALSDYAGCRYRLTTKTKVKRKIGEDVKSYIDRLGMSVSSYDFPIGKNDMDPKGAMAIHKSGFENSKSKAEKDYLCNFANCTQYYRPCEFFSQCHGQKFFEA